MIDDLRDRVKASHDRIVAMMLRGEMDESGRIADPMNCVDCNCPKCRCDGYGYGRKCCPDCAHITQSEVR